MQIKSWHLLHTIHFKRKKLSNNSSWDFEYVLHTSDTYFANQMAMWSISLKATEIKIRQNFYFKRTFRYPELLRVRFVSNAHF